MVLIENQAGPEINEFRPESNGILATSGIAEAASKKKNRRECRRIIRGKYPEFTTVDDMIDALLEMQGFRLYPLDPMYGNASDAFDGAY